MKGEKKTRQGGRESGARCLPPRLVPTRALRQEGGFPTRTQRPSPIPHGPAMNPGQREHRRREVLDRRISPPLEESRRWAWWAETPVLVDAKPGGSPYVHCESTGKSGGSLRAHRNFLVFPLVAGIGSYSSSKQQTHMHTLADRDHAVPPNDIGGFS